MTQLKWDQQQDQTFQEGLDRGVIYPTGDGVPVVWNGLISVEDSGESTVKEFFIDGIKYLSVVSPRDWKGTVEAYTYPDEFAELIGISTIGDGLSVDSQMPEQFDLSYRTMIGTQFDKVQQYKIHLIYSALASLGSFTNTTLTADGTSPIPFQFDLTATPIFIPERRPSAHVIIDTRDLDAPVREKLEGILYGTETTEPTMPTVTELNDMLNFGDEVIVVDNGDGTWTATGSIKNVYMTSADNFQIDNVSAEYTSADVYVFFGDGPGEGIWTLGLDTDGVSFYQLGAGSANLGVDTDGVPYYSNGSNEAALLIDTDGAPYILTDDD